ncbi:MAG: DUF3037 domain-containing protein [Bacteroidales bacterium]|nr:DUF3037 domain-containing protein [Bacteroidales bacterium]
MQSKPDNSVSDTDATPMHLYEYAVVRYLPAVEREEFVNVGLVMMCKRRRWVRARIGLPRDLLRLMSPQADIDAVAGQLASFERIAAGTDDRIGSLDAHERFRWMTAVRSACISTSRPHPGKTTDLDTTFDRLFDELVKR